MITPKTDWVAHDYFTSDDYARIIHNLNEVAGIVGATVVNYLNPNQSMILTQNERQQIAGQCAEIARLKGWPPPVESSGGYWFNWDELNRIEQLCANVTALNGSVLRHGAPLRHGNNASYGGGVRG